MIYWDWPVSRHTTGITGSISGAQLATDGRKPDGDRSLLALLKDRSASDVGDVVGGLEVAMGTDTLGVDL